MPRALPQNPALIVETPGPLTRSGRFPFALLPFPFNDLRAAAGFDLLPANGAGPHLPEDACPTEEPSQR